MVMSESSLKKRTWRKNAAPSAVASANAATGSHRAGLSDVFRASPSIVDAVYIDARREATKSASASARDDERPLRIAGLDCAEFDPHVDGVAARVDVADLGGDAPRPRRRGAPVERRTRELALHRRTVAVAHDA